MINDGRSVDLQPWGASPGERKPISIEQLLALALCALPERSFVFDAFDFMPPDGEIRISLDRAKMQYTVYYDITPAGDKLVNGELPGVGKVVLN